MTPEQEYAIGKKKRTNGTGPRSFQESQPEELKTRIYEEEKAFEQLAEAWKDLTRRTGATVYMSPEWTENWWNCFGRHKRRSLFLLSIWNGDKMIALAPMYKGCTGMGPVRIERRLQILGSGGSPNEQLGFLDDYGISDFLDFLVEDKWSPAVAKIVAELFLSGEAGVDKVTLHQAGDHSFVKQHLYPELIRRGADATLEHTDTCPFIDLEGKHTLKEYVSGVKSNARRRFRQTLRAIGPGKKFTFERPVSAGDVERAGERVVRMHQERWNKLGFPGVFHDPRFDRFFRHLLQEAWKNEWLWFAEAVSKEGVCASRMILFYNGRYYDYISGFDDESEVSRYRPGIGLLLHLIEEAIDSGVGRIELLRGEEGYKYDFTTENFRNWRIGFVTPEGKTVPKRTGASLLRFPALLYRIVAREQKLLRVQREQHGLAGMLPGYLSFRWTSLKLKWKD